MRRFRFAIVLLCALAPAAPAAAQVPDDLGARLIERYVQPATRQFAAATAALNGAVEFMCRAPDEQRMETARRRFGDTVDAWMRLSILRFGPLVEDNRFERVFFWPDPRGVTQRQMQQLLASGDVGALDAYGLRQKSVAVQGLPALEHLLFGEAAAMLLTDDAAARYRCGYAAAIAHNLRLIAADIDAAWSEGGALAGDFGNPAPQNPLYRSTGEVTAEVVKAMSTSLRFLADAMIAPFLGREPEAANPKLAPLWRSRLTGRAVRAQIEAIRSLYAAAGFADALPAESRWIDGSLLFEFRRAAESLDGLGEPVGEAAGGGPGRAALVYVVIALRSLRETVDARLAPALGVAVGFNALDGD